MKAEIKPNVDTNRQELSSILPLSAPFTIYVEQTRICNAKCFYCIHSTRDDEKGPFRKLGFDLKHMPKEDFQLVLNELKTFPLDKLKRIVFSGLGEPLANPQMPEYAKMIVDSAIAQRVEVITNGLLLNKKKADELIDAGITNTNISIQGISPEQYKKTCGVNVDIYDLIDKIRYLYNNRGKMKLYIKVIDVALESEEDKKRFYEMFSSICDKIYIEHIVQMQQQHTNITDKVTPSTNMYGYKCDTNRKVCGQSFYFLQIGCDLDIFPCSIPGLRKGFSIGNLKKQSILDIWNGKKRNAFLRAMLRFEKDKFPECKTCVCYNVIDDPTENLDHDAPQLLKLFEDR